MWRQASNFNPENTQCIPPVNPPEADRLPCLTKKCRVLQRSLFEKGDWGGFFLKQPWLIEKSRIRQLISWVKKRFYSEQNRSALGLARSRESRVRQNWAFFKGDELVKSPTWRICHFDRREKSYLFNRLQNKDFSFHYEAVRKRAKVVISSGARNLIVLKIRRF